MAASTPPQHHPSPRELDDLELLINGALSPLQAFNEPGSAVTIDLPHEVVEAAAPEGVVELVDPEGLPLARLTLDGRVMPLTGAMHGPFRALHLSPEEAQRRYAGRTWIPVVDALSEVQLAAAREAGDVVFLALIGTGTPLLSPVGLMRATVAAAKTLPVADVVAVPLASHGDPDVDHHLGVQVAENYADGDRILGLPDDEDGFYPAFLTDIVDFDQPPLDRRGLVVFFTGLSGSGKSTLAQAFIDRLLEQGRRTVTSLDGDVVRRHLSAGLTFSKQDRETNIRRIGWVAAEISRHGGVAVCSPIAPFDETRQQVRQMVEAAGGSFFLVHVATPLEECERRDRKGLYAKARRGQIPEFTGISSPYEVPADADVSVDTTGRTIEEALSVVLDELRDDGLLDLGNPLQPQKKEPLRVLFVCTANICRSAYLETKARELLGTDSGLEVSSAGTHGFHDHPVSEEMRPALDAAGIDWSGFRSRRLTGALIEEADLVLTAEAAHRAFILEEWPEAFRKVSTLGQFTEVVDNAPPEATPHDLLELARQRRGSADPDHDIADPYRRGADAATIATDRMDGLLAKILPRLSRRSTISGRSLD